MIQGHILVQIDDFGFDCPALVRRNLKAFSQSHLRGWYPEMNLWPDLLFCRQIQPHPPPRLSFHSLREHLPIEGRRERARLRVRQEPAHPSSTTWTRSKRQI